MKTVLQILISIAVYTAKLDPITKEFWAELLYTNGETNIQMVSDLAADKAAILIWDTIFCATPKTSTVDVEITVDCIVGAAKYADAVVAGNDSFFSTWTPELSRLVEVKTTEIKNHMILLLSDLAKVYFDGDTSARSGPYVITLRD